jgi:hypothetical protein
MNQSGETHPVTDPRIDLQTIAYWNDLIDQIRTVIDGSLYTGPASTTRPARAALHAVLDLHVPWEFREQQKGPDDVIIGVGCRACGIKHRVPEDHLIHTRPCQTILEIEAYTLGHPSPADLRPGTRWVHRAHPGAVFEYAGADNHHDAHQFVLVEGVSPDGCTGMYLKAAVGLRGLSPVRDGLT